MNTYDYAQLEHNLLFFGIGLAFSSVKKMMMVMLITLSKVKKLDHDTILYTMQWHAYLATSVIHRKHYENCTVIKRTFHDF